MDFPSRIGFLNGGDGYRLVERDGVCEEWTVQQVVDIKSSFPIASLTFLALVRFGFGGKLPT